MITVFMYHQIANLPFSNDPLHLAVPPEKFEQQMRYLHDHNYKSISLKDAVNYWRKGQAHPPKLFVLTFDDGYQDFYTTVFPILDKYKFKATVFLVANQVGQKTDWQGQRNAQSAQLMTWSEIRELSQYGITFGNHTLTHPRLTKLKPEIAQREISDAKLKIEDNLGIEVDLFCYPFTANNKKIQQLVEESGHVAACAGDRGKWSLFNIWRDECRRIDSLRSFCRKAKGRNQHLIWLREQSILGQTLVPVVRHVRKFLYNEAGALQA